MVIKNKKTKTKNETAVERCLYEYHKIKIQFLCASPCCISKISDIEKILLNLGSDPKFNIIKKPLAKKTNRDIMGDMVRK